MYKIKVGVLISYDYKYFKNSLPTYYKYVDEIVLAIDQDRKTWSGIPFVIEEEFFKWIKEVDVNNKIRIYEDNFHLPNLNALENDSRERTLLGKFMGDGGWHIQIDADEYFIDFPSFINDLRVIEKGKTQDLTIWLKWVTLYKKCKNGYVFINSNEQFPIATTKPEYVAARVTKNTRKVELNHKVIHQSWARKEQEISQKLESWGHNIDFPLISYFNFWKAIDDYTYKFVQNFHPLTPHTWPKLEYCKATTVEELIHNLKDYKWSIPAKKSLIKRILFKIYRLIKNK